MFLFQELEGHSLGTSSQFDTFGFTAVELARKQVEKEQKHRFLFGPFFLAISVLGSFIN